VYGNNLFGIRRICRHHISISILPFTYVLFSHLNYKLFWPLLLAFLTFKISPHILHIPQNTFANFSPKNEIPLSFKIILNLSVRIDKPFGTSPKLNFLDPHSWVLSRRSYFSFTFSTIQNQSYVFASTHILCCRFCCVYYFVLYFLVLKILSSAHSNPSSKLNRQEPMQMF